MDVAITGDRACCLTQQLGDETYVFAVASGFGAVEGRAATLVLLGRLRAEFERRARAGRLRRRQRRPKGVTGELLCAVSRVNEDLHARTAAHDDYVTAGCSLTTVLLIDDHAYLAHVGSTAAYLSRDGYVVALTKNDAFETDGAPILTHALLAAPRVEVALCSFSLNEGDALVLAGKRLREADDRRRLAHSLIHTPDGQSSGDQLLVVRYSRPQGSDAGEDAPLYTPGIRILTGIVATVVFYALLCIG